jgi:hypothetical protein
MFVSSTERFLERHPEEASLALFRDVKAAFRNKRSSKFPEHDPIQSNWTTFADYTGAV